MPESCESQASFEIVDVAVTALIKEDVSLRIENIEIDATQTEQKRFKDHPARSGLPYAIDSKFTMWHTPGKKMSEHLLTELLLKDISYTHRALILDLGPLFLIIQWMTHTAPHLGELVNKKVRKFKVKMAFIFESHVLAFNSNDLVFQPTWADSRDKLPPRPNWVFLTTLTAWLRCLGGYSDRNGLACDIIRSANNMFLGIGVYTVIEIFFLAGLSPLLTEEEVFSNPSRTASQWTHTPKTRKWVKMTLKVLFGGAAKPVRKFTEEEIDHEANLMAALADAEEDARPDDGAIECDDDDVYVP
ncbi:hypothetical protein B0H10DRAFT_2196446 [Mycena sp. CBHHK59/15]|nr:hypothetical protein B0H10DRAFT_2196446 [Mycena sp. CBHHK59/15]